MLMRSNLILVLACLLFPAFASGFQKWVYIERTGKSVEKHTYFLEPVGDGMRVILVRQGSGGETRDECEMDASFSTRSWRFIDPMEKTDVTAVRSDDTIELAGMHEGRNIRKTFRINGLPWMQLFSIDFSSFVTRAEPGSGFWSIGTAGMGDMKVAQFKVQRRESRWLKTGSGSVEAVCLRISLAGMMSVLWHGDYWMRKNDGRYLRHEGRNGLFGVKTIKELVSEE